MTRASKLLLWTLVSQISLAETLGMFADREMAIFIAALKYLPSFDRIKIRLKCNGISHGGEEFSQEISDRQNLPGG